MGAPSNAPLPAAVALDAYVLARLLFRLERRGGADETRVGEIGAAGRMLHSAWKLARCEPGSLGSRAARDRAREGMARLAALPWAGTAAELVTMMREAIG